MWSRLLKSVMAGALVLHATFALALPTPKDIEAAVAAGHNTQAETMLREVLRDKPQSAKAHYELGQVLAREHRYQEAHNALQKAKELDPSLKFASSPDQFNTAMAKVSDLAAAPTSSVVMAPSATPGTHAPTPTEPVRVPSHDGGLTYVWLAIAGLVVLGLWLRRKAVSQAVSQVHSASVPPAAMPVGTPVAPRGFGAQFTPNAAPPGYAPQGYAQPMGGGATMTGAVVGGLAGVAAGYALSKALEGDHHTAAPSSAGDASVASNGGYVPFDTPSQPDLGTFDAGAGNDWDSADSGGGSDDSW